MSPTSFLPFRLGFETVKSSRLSFRREISPKTSYNHRSHQGLGLSEDLTRKAANGPTQCSRLKTILLTFRFADDLQDKETGTDHVTCLLLPVLDGTLY